VAVIQFYLLHRVGHPQQRRPTVKEIGELNLPEDVRYAEDHEWVPVGGEVLSVNTALEDAPERVNTAPYENGWMIEIKPENPAEAEALMDRAAYLKLLEGR
jgi:glycine cleavage system H protein